MRRTSMRRVLKWPGGKADIADQIYLHFPSLKDRIYREPFVGGGGMLCHVLNQNPKIRASIGDANQDLVTLYTMISIQPWYLIREIGALEGLTHDEIRSRYNDLDPKDHKNAAPRAVLLAALSRTSFNGLFRLNRNGKHNVPKRIAFLTERDVRHLCAAFDEAHCLFNHRVTRIRGDYLTHTAEPGDVVYFDPPYDGGFAEYTADGFDQDRQHQLAQHFRDLVTRGVSAFLSNADTPLIRELYRGFKMVEITASRRIAAKATSRGMVKELLILPEKEK